MYMFFFFFKQKTAYEMRISDWSSDVCSSDLLREDLRTRLGWDLVFRLELLSDEDRVQALRTRAGERGLQLSPEVIGWVLTHYARDMGRLSALVDALDRYSLEKHRAITLPLLKDLLATDQPNREPNHS